jgi:hypothetical protein
MIKPTRRTFVAACSAALVAPVAQSRAAHAMLRRLDGGLPPSYPTLEPELVRELVSKAHFDARGVEKFVTAQPEISRAAWDWGFGDWETALGAASHMGRRDIAEVLFRNGARPDHFTYAMLGKVDVVRAICQSNPNIQRMPGPHGITLMQHARNGGDAAKSVVAYLEEIGDADLRQVNRPLGEVESEPFVGDYRPLGAPEVVFRVGFHPKQKIVTFQRGENPSRFLMYHGANEFHPSGAPTVKITFNIEGDKADYLRIEDGRLELVATRIV